MLDGRTLSRRRRLRALQRSRQAWWGRQRDVLEARLRASDRAQVWGRRAQDRLAVVASAPSSEAADLVDLVLDAVAGDEPLEAAIDALKTAGFTNDAVAALS